jgi:hypothetical protein
LVVALVGPRECRDGEGLESLGREVPALGTSEVDTPPSFTRR